MKTRFFALAIFFIGLHGVVAQPTITNAELFQVGEIIILQECDTSAISEGNKGVNQVWDFSTLIPYGGPITAEIYSPEMLGMETMYPNSDRVEKWSNGKYVVSSNQSDASRLEAFIDSINGFSIRYPSPLLFSKRPISYGDVYQENFTSSYTVGGYDFKGGGSVKIEADAYGTLVLPNGNHQNVLRVKMHQTEVDTLIQFGTTTAFETITYLWFDGISSAALFKINYTISDIPSKSVSYLVNQTVGIKKPLEQLKLEVYPNPFNQNFMIEVESESGYRLYDDNGRLITTGRVSVGESQIGNVQWSSGKYFLEIFTNKGQYRTKIIIKK